MKMHGRRKRVIISGNGEWWIVTYTVRLKWCEVSYRLAKETETLKKLK
jgi:hypothetical protein